MSTLVTIGTLVTFAAAIGWVVYSLRKYQARKALEREREAEFLAEMLRAKPQAATAPGAPAAPAVAVAAAAAAPAPGPTAAAATPAPPPPSDPLEAAAHSIRSALSAGRAADAAKTFLGVLAERTKLTLEPAVWEGLGRALLEQGAFMESAWALHAGAALAGDLAIAQKRLVEVANRAGDAGQPQHAIRLYQTLLAKYPQSQYADFVRANIKEQERKLKA
jgi:TolA-binding protein